MTGEAEHGAAGDQDPRRLPVPVVEDRSLIAIRITQVLRKAGHAVVGPVATLAAGLEIARRDDSPLGAAVLDIDLDGEQVFPLAEALRARRVPFLFLTGYGRLVVPEPWRDVIRVEKPFDAAGRPSRRPWRAVPPRLMTRRGPPPTRRSPSANPGR